MNLNAWQSVMTAHEAVAMSADAPLLFARVSRDFDDRLTTDPHKGGVLPTMWQQFGSPFVRAGLIKFVHDIIMFTGVASLLVFPSHHYCNILRDMTNSHSSIASQNFGLYPCLLHAEIGQYELGPSCKGLITKGKIGYVRGPGGKGVSALSLMGYWMIVTCPAMSKGMRCYQV